MILIWDSQLQEQQSINTAAGEERGTLMLASTLKPTPCTRPLTAGSEVRGKHTRAHTVNRVLFREQSISSLI